MDLRELFTPNAISANWQEVASDQIPYLGEGLFTARKKAGLDLRWIKGAKGLPISLMPSAFDAKATFRDRIGIETLETEMPFFREGFKLKERDRQDLLRISETADPYAADVIARVYDDANELIKAADVVAERERMQLLFPVDGNLGISIVANGVDYTYNYDPDGVWKATNYFEVSDADDAWDSSLTADPFADIQNARAAVQAATGNAPAIAIMNNNTFQILAKTQAVKERALRSNQFTFGTLTSAEVKNAVQDAAEVQVIVYDKMYRDENKVAHRFVPDGYVALVPAGALGNTYYGTTPEEADLMGSNAGDVTIVNTGVAVTRIVDPHPVNINIFASEIVLPSYERMDEVAVLKVLMDSEGGSDDQEGSGN